MNPFGLGGKSRQVDDRDYDISSYGSATPTPPSYQSPVPTIYMQDKYPTCGGHAPAPVANILFNRITSPKYMWDEIKQIDGIDPNDGTTMDSIFKSWKNSGICMLSLLPDDLGKSLADYTNPGNVTNDMIIDAQSRKIDSYAFTNRPTMQQIKDAIYKFKGVILLVDCGDGWWANGWSESSVCPLRLGNYVDGHFIAATGFDEKYIYGPNSWSTQWGRNGMYYFDESYIPHVREMGVAIITQEPQKYVFTRDMRYGDINADVHQLQIRLGVPVSLTVQSGQFGFLTLIAVVKFQIMNKLPITGLVDQRMRDLLNT